MRFTSYGNSCHPATSSTVVWRRSLWRHAIVLALGLGTGVAAHAQFSSTPYTPTNAQNGSAVWGDYNNDGKMDVLFSGSTSASGGSPFADIYDNASGFSGIGGLTGVGSPSGSGTGRNRSAWGDYDNDGDLDVVITGDDGTGPTTTLYTNNAGTFNATTISPVGFIGLTNSSVAWADFDNDGDLDLFVSGFQTGGAPYTTVYRNDGPGSGSWNFTDITSSIAMVGDGEGAWGDYDNDGDMDLVVAGDDGSGTPKTVLYENMAGVFMINTAGITFMDLRASSLAWGDFDNDGDLDLAITGFDAGGNRRFRLYRNLGGTSFAPVLSTGVTAVSDGSLAWGDCNNDGYLDLLVTGNDGTGPVTVVYMGNGTGTFTTMIGSGLTAVVYGQGSWGDFDNDGKLDVALTGNDGTNPFSGIFVNKTSKPDVVPPAPATLAVTVYWKTLTATWTPPPSAGTTPLSALSYNLQVTDLTSGGVIIEPAEADLSSGYRRVPALGNADEDLTWTITNLTPGHSYQVCVQAVDHAWQGSKFTCTQATLPTTGPDAMIGDCSGDVGAEPNSACWAYYLSPDIWVRNANDGGTTHQAPIGGSTNYVYVKLTNLSSTDIANGIVQVFFAKASAGLGWSHDWVNKYIGGLTYGDFIGYATASVPAGGTQTVVVQWNGTPNPSYYSDPDAHHFCLMARFTGPGDPITFAEGNSHPTNVQNNNNVAWKNLSIIDMPIPSPVTAPIEVNNPTDAATTVDLHLFVENQDDSFFDHRGTINVDLGADGYAAWVNNGAQGTGVSPLSDQPDNTKVSVDAEDATIAGIPLDVHQQITAHVTFDAPYNRQLAGRKYNWLLEEQLSDDTHALLGGEGYEITMPRNSGQGKPSLSSNTADAAREYRLDARPNPTSGSTSISYVLPSNGTVELAIYDAAGHLIRTLSPAAEQKQGSHVAEWNGLNESGVQVPSGTYFYRLQVGEKSMEGQIKIVR